MTPNAPADMKVIDDLTEGVESQHLTSDSPSAYHKLQQLLPFNTFYALHLLIDTWPDFNRSEGSG